MKYLLIILISMTISSFAYSNTAHVPPNSNVVSLNFATKFAAIATSNVPTPSPPQVVTSNPCQYSIGLGMTSPADDECQTHYTNEELAERQAKINSDLDKILKELKRMDDQRKAASQSVNTIIFAVVIYLFLTLIEWIGKVLYSRYKRSQ